MIGRMARSNPDHLAAWLAFSGAIAVALIAAMTAQWRLHVTNKAEKGRLDTRLAVDSAQHLDRLEHERKLKVLKSFARCSTTLQQRSRI